MVNKDNIIPVERIERTILLIRGEKVILDADLASLYEVETKNLVRAVKRNLARFPSDFMFQLTRKELTDLRFHFGTSSQWGGRRYLPYAFTEFREVFKAIRDLMQPDAASKRHKIGFHRAD